MSNTRISYLKRFLQTAARAVKEPPLFFEKSGGSLTVWLLPAAIVAGRSVVFGGYQDSILRNSSM